MKPKIGLIDQGTDSLLRRYMRYRYQYALKKAGADFIMLKAVDTEDEALANLKECCGLVIPGGPDINPELYGEQPKESSHVSAPIRDISDPLYLKAALSLKLPILGICRGCQLLNVYYGGTLYQDILQDAKGHHLTHMQPKGFRKKVHQVSVKPDTLLYRLAGRSMISVNTMHHQGIHEVGKGLTVSGISEDGIVEGIEVPGSEFILGVQWHPEHLTPKDEVSKQLFAKFVTECERGAAK